jgi:hypothetical protein
MLMFQSDHDAPGGKNPLISHFAPGGKNPLISHEGPAAKML